jgi:Ceramidase
MNFNWRSDFMYRVAVSDREHVCTCCHTLQYRCEENYMHSHYVAETWNTVTSFIIAVAGLVAAHSARACGAEFRYELLGYLLCIVGLGSIAFHAALQHWMQVCMKLDAACMHCFAVDQL